MNEEDSKEIVSKEDGRSSEAVKKDKAEAARKRWLNYTPEERAAITQKQKEAARKMWAERNRTQRAKIGKLISEGRRGGGSRKVKEAKPSE